MGFAFDIDKRKEYALTAWLIEKFSLFDAKYVMSSILYKFSNWNINYSFMVSKLNLLFGQDSMHWYKVIYWFYNKLHVITYQVLFIKYCIH